MYVYSERTREKGKNVTYFCLYYFTSNSYSAVSEVTTQSQMSWFSRFLLILDIKSINYLMLKLLKVTTIPVSVTFGHKNEMWHHEKSVRDFIDIETASTGFDSNRRFKNIIDMSSFNTFQVIIRNGIEFV